MAMIIEHRSARPQVHPEAVVSPAAHLLGDVVIGPGTVVLAGAVIVAEGAPVRIGHECVLMEHAVIRGAGSDACTIGDHVLVGPHAYVCGATIESECFLATGTAVFNKARVGRGSTIAVHGVVHVATQCPADTFVPLGQVALGDPAVVYAAAEVLDMHSHLFALGFTDTVFGFESSHLSNGEATRELCRRYARSLARHGADRMLDAVATPDHPAP
jgi:carbonic anhydrase/acetyltransferase-like protein (isoleucine patch superfamily)